MNTQLNLFPAPAVVPAPALDCPDCETVRRRMKRDGFRNWRDHACGDHAVLDFDQYLAARGLTSILESDYV